MKPMFTPSVLLSSARSVPPGLSLGLKLMLVSSMMTALSFGSPFRALAHGVVIKSEPIQSLRMQALYDSGDPMAEAQVTIYSPADPKTPWQTLQADEQGYFTFIPDSTIPGNWDVQVRKAGHGDLVRVAVDDKGSEATLAYAGHSAQHNFDSPVQRWTTIAMGVWGFVGTALFFAQRQTDQTSSRESDAETDTGQ